jgi:hypothetical protein
MLCKRNRTTELSRNFYTWSRASPANLRSAASSRRASQSRNHWSRQYRLARSQWWPAARTSIAAGRDRAKAQTSPRKSAARFRQCRPKTQSRRGMSSSGISFEIIKEFVAAYRAPLAGKIIVYPSNPIALVTSKEAETLISPITRFAISRGMEMGRR